MDRDVQFFGFIVPQVVAQLKGSLPAEEVDGHALDRANVHECMSWLWVEEVGRGQDLRIKAGVVKIFALEALAVDLVNLVELQAGLRLEGREGIHRLGGKSTAI